MAHKIGWSGGKGIMANGQCGRKLRGSGIEQAQLSLDNIPKAGALVFPEFPKLERRGYQGRP